jgi:diguanylate cyclase (GGDEF)-like protein/PAS domain S-box-containing protein
MSPEWFASEAARASAMTEELRSLGGDDVDQLIRELSACRTALAEVEAVQRTFWKTLRMGIVIHNRDTTVAASNATALELFGLTAEQLAGKSAADPAWHFVREDGAHLAARDHPVNIVLRSGRALENYVVGIVREDRGDVVWGLFNAAPSAGSDGAIQKIVVTFVDISERKRVEERLRLLSEKDALTELPNRRFFAEILDREWRLAVRYNLPVSLIMIDIDFFKAYNDRYGHLAGDACLIRVARALSEALRRPTDFLARYGGEEFVLLLQNTDISGAATIAEELRATVEQLQIPHADATARGCVTISLGVAKMSPKREDQISELLLAADNALYRAKYLGKNQVIIAGE